MNFTSNQTKIKKLGLGMLFVTSLILVSYCHIELEHCLGNGLIPTQFCVRLILPQILSILLLVKIIVELVFDKYCCSNICLSFSFIADSVLFSGIIYTVITDGHLLSFPLIVVCLAYLTISIYKIKTFLQSKYL
jgi:hypothetical protein